MDGSTPNQTLDRPALARPVAERARDDGAELAARVGGAVLAEEVQEYFEHGACVARGDVVVDVGANVGAFAATVAARTAGEVTLHCFEPAPPIFEELRRNFAEHDLLARTRHHLHNVALTTGDRHGAERPFYYFRRFPRDSTYDLDRKNAEFAAFFAKQGRDVERSLARWGAIGRLIGAGCRAVLTWFCRPARPAWMWIAWKVTGMQELPCRLASLDRILEEHGPADVDLLKIDVEGAELDVLRGASRALRTARWVAVETDERDGLAQQVVELLEGAGMRVVSRRAPRCAELGDAGQVLVVASRAVAGAS